MATQPNQPKLGLMATQPKGTGAPKTNVGQNKTQPYQAQTYNVNPQALVENRVAGLMSQDSEAMKIARENAQRLSASRGLQSSSIATENAMNAMFNFATPIAQQDANTIATQDLTNQSMQHDVGMANLGTDNQIRVNQQQQGFQAGESALDRELQSTLQSNQFDFTANQNQMDRQQQTDLQNSQFDFTRGESALDRAFQQSMQNDSQSFTAEQNQLDRTQQTNLQNDQQAFVSGESALDRTLQQTLQSDAQQFTADQANLDRNLQRELQDLQYQQSLGLLDAEGQQRLRELEVQFANDQAMQANQNAFIASQSQLDRNQQAALQNDAQAFTSEQSTLDRNLTRELQDLQYQQSLGLLDAEGEQRLTELSAQFENQQVLQNDSQQFTAQQANADRNFTANQSAADRALQTNLQESQQAFNREMQELQYQQQQGLLDQEGQQRLQEMEVQNEYANAQIDRQAQIQTERDNLLQEFAQANMSQEQLYTLEQIATQAQNAIDLTNMQNDYAMRLEAANSISAAVNEAMASMGNAMMNPEIDSTLYNQIQANVTNMLNDQVTMLSDIYGSDLNVTTGGSNTGDANNDTTVPGTDTPEQDIGLMQPSPNDIAANVGNNNYQNNQWFDQYGNYTGA